MHKEYIIEEYELKKMIRTHMIREAQIQPDDINNVVLEKGTKKTGGIYARVQIKKSLKEKK